MNRRLLVIGAGPKALALATKADALRSCGYPFIEVVIVEKYQIAAHWNGKFGYTDGAQVLGTPPEKDVGFPYASKFFRREADLYVLNDYSWQAFNIRRWSAHPEALDSYSEDVDRGIRGQPVHSQWAEYLCWVGQKIAATAEILVGEVIAIATDGGHWKLTVQTAQGPKEISGDGLVITGPGPAKRLNLQPDHPRIFDGKSFWLRLSYFAGAPWDDEPIAIVGSGETAASVVIALARTLRHPVPIYVVNRQGTIFTRGEGYWENHLFTDPEIWPILSSEERAEIIRRTDRGVFSVGAMAFINQLRNVFHKRMDVSEIEIVTQHELEPEGRPVLIDRSGLRLPVQYAVVAIGFDPWWFVGLFTDDRLRALMNSVANRDILISHIQPDLSFPTDRVPTPKLHVPMLAGLAQGPGFPNLSCLGLLSDRILASYLES